MTIIKIVASILVASLIIDMKNILSALPIAIYAYVIAWLLVGLAYVCFLACRFALFFVLANVHLEYYISSHKWVIQGVLYAIFILYMLVDSASNTTSTRYSERTSKPSSVLKSTVVSSAIARNKNTNRISPSVNISDIKKKVSSGMSVRIDWCKTSLYDIDAIVGLANKSGATITIIFSDANKLELHGVIDNMVKFADKAPGRIIYKTPISANFFALKIAQSGARFYCDNSSGSSLIGQIAHASRDSNGHVTFVHCSKSSLLELQRLKQECGNHMDVI